MRLVAVGDIMLGRDMPDASTDVGHIMAAEVLEALSGDVVTGNWECTITNRKPVNPFSHAPFRVTYAGARPVAELFHVVSLANNHVYDFMNAGVVDTLTSLGEWGVGVVGIGTSTSEAYRCWVKERGGISVGILGATTVSNLPPGRTEFCVAECGWRLDEAVRGASTEHDLVVVHVHAGGGDVPHPSPDTRALHAHLRRMGAQVIIGHHPHVPQGWICTDSFADFFSLGDFLFDQRTDGRDVALMAWVEWDGSLASCECLPVVRGEDLRIDLAITDREIRTELAVLNDALTDGESDKAYAASMGAAYPAVLLESLRRDLRAGGWRAVARRVARIDRRRVCSALRLLSSYVQGGKGGRKA